MRYFVSAMLVITGIVHILPLPGVLGSDQLQRLYGLVFEDPNLSILMRHRAVLFGLLGGLMFYAAYRKDLQIVALVAGLVSTVSFVWIAWTVGDYNAAISRVVAADWVAIACLVAGLIARLKQVSSERIRI